MKKILLVVAVTGIMTSCKDKKKTEETIITPATEQPATPTTTEPAPNASTTPLKFSDPEVQKIVTEYTAFVAAYNAEKQHPDLAKEQQYSNTSKEWTAKMQKVYVRLANAEEIKKWDTWALAIANNAAAK